MKTIGVIGAGTTINKIITDQGIINVSIIDAEMTIAEPTMPSIQDKFYLTEPLVPEIKMSELRDGRTLRRERRKRMRKSK